ncbi:polysaccharide deacetylase family protein [Nanoarchaeota archaeon]
MDILVISHANKDYDEKAINGAWEILPYHFKKLGHKVRTIKKSEWWLYPFIYLNFKPEIVISIGRISGLITAFHKHIFNTNALFVHDLTDHPHFYKSDTRIRYMCKNHDIIITPSKYNFDKYHCDYLLANGSDFKPIKSGDFEYDACYLGQVHGFYKIDELKIACKKENITLKVINDTPTYQVPGIIEKCKICIYPISWDSSTKIGDYAAMGKPVVAVKPNLSETIGYPAHYTSNLVDGIKYLLKNKKLSEKLGDDARKWFLNYSGSWEQQAKKYIKILGREIHKQIFTMDVEKDIDAALDFANLLSEYQIKGEFYITGKLVEKYPEKVKKIEKYGHVIGGHGYDHENFSKLSYDEAEKVIKKTIEVFKRNNISIKGWRFPWLKFKTNQLNILSDLGLFDSSIRDKNYAFLGFVRKWLSDLKRGIFSLPTPYPKRLRELPWSVADLSNNEFYNLQGRFVTHCHNYAHFRLNLRKYLNTAHKSFKMTKK